MDQLWKILALIVLAFCLFGHHQVRGQESDLVWSTFLGGEVGDIAWSLAVDKDGNVYLTGNTLSDRFPITAGAFDTTYNGGEDVFVAKLNPTGSTLIYSTFLGGSSYEIAKDLAADDDGNVYLTGETYSANFPSTPGAFDAVHHKQKDAFVSKLNATGSALYFSTFLGGTHDDRGLGIAVDSSSSVYIVGQTCSADFPTTELALQRTHHGDGDAFVVKFNRSGGILDVATLLGGKDDDSGRDIAVDKSGHIHITGYTSSEDFPVTSGAFDVMSNGREDVFVAKLAPAGDALCYATFLGGDGEDKGLGIDIDDAGKAHVTGHTKSADFPFTKGAFDSTLGGDVDLFVVKLDTTGSELEYASYLGGSRMDYGQSIVLNSDGNVLVTGYTKSDDFPVTAGAFDGTYNGGWDVLVVKLDTGTGVLPYATFLGGSRSEKGLGIAVDETGIACVTGYTFSSDFPTTVGAYRCEYLGKNADVFVAKLMMGVMGR